MKGVFLFADFYDSTSTSLRILKASKDLFSSIKFVYWARTGIPRKIPKDGIYKDINFDCFVETAPPQSKKIYALTFKYQFWLLQKLRKENNNFVVALTFYTILPALIYKYLFNRKCKVIYDPRDYVADSFSFNKIGAFVLRLADNLFIKLSDFVVFPDEQYFIYYGMFPLKREKCLVLPNSTEDQIGETEKIDIYEKYNLPKEKHLIPILGYFAEGRGEKVLFELIRKNRDDLHFVVAGDIRDEEFLRIFKESKNVSFLGKVPYLDALTILKSSLLSPQLYEPKLKNNAYAFATKYFDCLMVGTPIVVSRGQILQGDEIEKYHFGWVIDYDDTTALEEITDSEIQGSQIDKGRMREYFLKNYDFNLFKPKLRAAYERFIT